ncbi:MAG: hypothetical protein AAGD25_31840 [Cyanobacteria bacterium P01_F01_bin.150]
MFNSPNDFLTEDESLAVDQSLLSAKEKFSTRVAIYSLRVLKKMTSESKDISALTPSDISEWLMTQQETGTNIIPGLEPDPAFGQFFTQIVLSSMKPLKQMAAESQKSLDELQCDEVIAWFEKEAKVRVEFGEQSTFLGQSGEPQNP